MIYGEWCCFYTDAVWELEWRIGWSRTHKRGLAGACSYHRELADAVRTECMLAGKLA